MSTLTPAALEKRLYTVKEARHLLSLGKTKMSDELRSGRLKSVGGVGKAKRIPAEAIDDYVALLQREAEVSAR